MKNKRLLFISYVLLVLIALVSLKLMHRQDNVATLAKNKETVELCSTSISFFSDFGENDFTCTGLTYDEKNNSFWIGDYGAVSSDATPAPRLIEVSSDLQKVETIIELDGKLSALPNLQGVAYDKVHDSLWLAVGDCIVNISKSGEVLSTISLGKYVKYVANGICYDETNDSLWVLCYTKYLLNYSKNGELLKSYDVNLKDQDHIAIQDGIIYATVGADYNGEENYIVSIDKNTGAIDVPFQLMDSYSVEGLSIVRGKLYITNDGAYHNAKINNSFICVYDWE